MGKINKYEQKIIEIEEKRTVLRQERKELSEEARAAYKASQEAAKESDKCDAAVEKHDNKLYELGEQIDRLKYKIKEAKEAKKAKKLEKGNRIEGDLQYVMTDKTVVVPYGTKVVILGKGQKKPTSVEE